MPWVRFSSKEMERCRILCPKTRRVSSGVFFVACFGWKPVCHCRFQQSGCSDAPAAPKKRPQRAALLVWSFEAFRFPAALHPLMNAKTKPHFCWLEQRRAGDSALHCFLEIDLP